MKYKKKKTATVWNTPWVVRRTLKSSFVSYLDANLAFILHVSKGLVPERKGTKFAPVVQLVTMLKAENQFISLENDTTKCSRLPNEHYIHVLLKYLFEAIVLK